jgi:hypothetical protein
MRPRRVSVWRDRRDEAEAGSIPPFRGRVKPLFAMRELCASAAEFANFSVHAPNVSGRRVQPDRAEEFCICGKEGGVGD